MVEISEEELTKLQKTVQSVKESQRKYNTTHRNKINQIARDYYAKHKDDESFKAKQREKDKRKRENRKLKAAQTLPKPPEGPLGV
jgi:hypothetical protein